MHHLKYDLHFLILKKLFYFHIQVNNKYIHINNNYYQVFVLYKKQIKNNH